MRHPASLRTAAALAVALLPWHGRAAAPANPLQGFSVAREQALQQAVGSGEQIYKASPEALAAAVGTCAAHDPDHAGQYVAIALYSGRNDADAIAPALVQAAIRGLGTDPQPDWVGGIVGDAVKAAPSEVLDIVTAAVKVSPRAAAPAIVRAAVSSVPDPDGLVTVDFQRRAERLASGDKQPDYKEASDGKSLAKQVTLAEAIVQAALVADPGLSAEVLTSAVNGGITSVPPPPVTVYPPIPQIPPPPFGVPGTVSP